MRHWRQQRNGSTTATARTEPRRRSGRNKASGNGRFDPGWRPSHAKGVAFGHHRIAASIRPRKAFSLLKHFRKLLRAESNILYNPLSLRLRQPWIALPASFPSFLYIIAKCGLLIQDNFEYRLKNYKAMSYTLINYSKIVNIA
jgi:hypothetical protein